MYCEKIKKYNTSLESGHQPNWAAVRNDTNGWIGPDPCSRGLFWKLFTYKNLYTQTLCVCFLINIPCLINFGEEFSRVNMMKDGGESSNSKPVDEIWAKLGIFLFSWFQKSNLYNKIVFSWYPFMFFFVFDYILQACNVMHFCSCNTILC